MILSYILSIASKMVCDWWIGIWSTEEFGFQTKEYIGIYVGLACAASVMYYFRGVLFGFYSLKIANSL